jgi:hypothetical protein
MARLIYKQRCNAPGKPKTSQNNRNHLNYIAKRPGVMKNEGQEHGLFGKLGEMGAESEIRDLDAALSRVIEKSKAHTNIYRAILSFSEEDALLLGLDERAAWESLVAPNMDIIARGMDIPLHRLEWAASVHAEQGHPHAHILFWDREQGVKDYFTQPERVNDIRKKLTKSVFSEQFAELYAEKSALEEAIREASGDLLGDTKDYIDSVSAKQFASYKEDLAALLWSVNPGRFAGRYGKPKDDALNATAAKLFEVSDAVPRRGRLAYGYMPPDVKKMLDELSQIVIESYTPSRRAFADYLKTAADISRMYSDNPLRHDEARRKAEERVMKMIGNKLLDAVKLIREKELEAASEQQRREMAFGLVTEVFSILSRCGQQEQARHHQYRSELSKAAKIEYAKRMESKGLDWE